MISLDYSILYQIVLFVVLWLIVSRVLFGPYLKLLEERERRTAGAEHDSVDLEHEAARLRARYEEQIAQAQAAGYAAKETIVQQGRLQKERLVSQAREEASKTLERVRQEVASEMQKEGQLAAAEARLIAQEMVSKVLGRKVG
jgi:F-type H+-transporting ATPase subunit b